MPLFIYLFCFALFFYQFISNTFGNVIGKFYFERPQKIMYATFFLNKLYLFKISFQKMKINIQDIIIYEVVYPWSLVTILN